MQKGCLFFLFFLLITLSLQARETEEIDPRFKVVGTMVVYGTAGGFLLGLASMAFQDNSRNIARGTSLGLYTGLFFWRLYCGFSLLQKISRRRNSLL